MSSFTVGKMQAHTLAEWGNADILRALRFSATLQLRTPLRVLRWHGKEITDPHQRPPAIAREPWEGIWCPVTRSFRELGVDLDEPAAGTMASGVGPVPIDGGDLLPLLIAIRTIVERDEPVVDRLANLKHELNDSRWAHWIERLGGEEKIASVYFPTFIGTIRGITVALEGEMRRRTLTTPRRIGLVSDASLLHIRGIGPAKVRLIRQACANDPEADEWVDRVTR